MESPRCPLLSTSDLVGSKDIDQKQMSTEDINEQAGSQEDKPSQWVLSHTILM